MISLQSIQNLLTPHIRVHQCKTSFIPLHGNENPQRTLGHL